MPFLLIQYQSFLSAFIKLRICAAFWSGVVVLELSESHLSKLVLFLPLDRSTLQMLFSILLEQETFPQWKRLVKLHYGMNRREPSRILSPTVLLFHKTLVNQNRDQGDIDLQEIRSLKKWFTRHVARAVWQVPFLISTSMRQLKWILRNPLQWVGAAVRGSTFYLAPAALAVSHVYDCTLCCLLLLCNFLARCMSCTCCSWVEVTGPRLLHYTHFTTLVFAFSKLVVHTSGHPPVPSLGWHAQLNEGPGGHGYGRRWGWFRKT